MARIFVYGKTESGFLQMDPGTALEMESYNDLFEESLEAGEFSLPVEFPWTDVNRRLLSFAERLQNFKHTQLHWVCDVYDETGLLILPQAKLTLLEKNGNFSYTRGKFVATISGNKGLFGSAIKKKNLRDFSFGGPITWAGKDSRKFAEDVMKGLHPEYYYIAFAPVVNENFFDTSKNYNDEFLALDTLNNILSTGSGANDWLFARPQSNNPTLPTTPGDAEYVDYRTVPFFNFQFIFQKIYEELGFVVVGDVMNTTDFKNLYIFNNSAIEYYSFPINADYTLRINPADHLPKMDAVDFLDAAFKFFNIYPTFEGNNRVVLRYRTGITKQKKIVDISKFCNDEFESVLTDVKNNESEIKQGYTLRYEWDSSDSYHGDRLPDLTKKTLVGTVATPAHLSSFVYSRPLTTDDMVYVVSENMYYAVANATTTPMLWDAFAEGLEDYVDGDGERDVSIGVGTLATFVSFDEDSATFQRRNKLAWRGSGSYINNKGVKVEKDIGLSLFYITKQNIGGNIVPVSHNHNTDSSGNEIEKVSLALKANVGIRKLHTEWQSFLNNNETVKVNVHVDNSILQEINSADLIMLHNVCFIPYRKEWSIPHYSRITLELKPI